MNELNPQEWDALAGPTLFEQASIMLVLFYSTGAFSTFLKGTSELPEGAPQGSAATNTIWVVIYIITLYLLCRRSSSVGAALRRNLPFILVLAVSVGSVFWSEAPKLTLMRSGALVGSTIVGMYFGLRFTVLQQLKLLAVMFGIAAALSIVFSIFVPAYGIGEGEYEGRWQGIYAHKNTLGNNMAVAFTVFIVWAASSPAYRRIKFVLAGIALALAVLADSVTSVFLCVSILCVFFIFKFFYSRLRRAWPYFLVLLAAMAAVIYYLSNFSEILYLVGRDENMSGRFLIWSLVWTAISAHPVLGYGYGAFWRGLDGPSADLWDALGSQFLFHAHNGFLDVWVDIGLLGLGVFLIAYIFYLRRAWSLFLNTIEPEMIWPVLFMIFLLLADLTEVGFLRVNTTSWILYISCVFSLVSCPQEQTEWSAEIAPATALSLESQA
jgi:exopolysaccharide production protein ExoQ